MRDLSLRCIARSIAEAPGYLMCGIGGFFAIQPVAQECVGAVQRALGPRGPDSQHSIGWDAGLNRVSGAWHSALIHSRLAIIDPQPLADQPMANDRGDIWIAYNGEVYDWQHWAGELAEATGPFRTRSDTEFILRGYEAWGIEKLLARLRGMFAFAIVDLRSGEAYLARDRMGEKPVVYSLIGDELFFGSVVRAILPLLPRSARRLSPEGIDAYLAHRYVPAPGTVYRHIQRLENAHYLKFDLRTRKLTKRCYWRPEPQSGSWLEALDESVRMRTTADRPLGFFLSGGVDSTVIASRLVAQGLTQFRGYTAAFQDPIMDESGIATETANALGLQHRNLLMPEAIGADFSRIIAALDEPISDPSSVPLWYLAKDVGREIKVVLAGDGGDELLAGYKRIGHHMRTAWRGRFRLPLRVPPSFQGGKIAAELAMDWKTAYSLRSCGFAPSQRVFLQPSFRLPVFSYFRAPDQQGGRGVENLLAIDLANFLPENVLRKSDLCTMAHGLEARAPLLDHRFIERLLAVPLDQRYTRPRKLLMQAALDGRLRPDFLERKKHGFNPPVGHWMRVELHDRLPGLGRRLESVTGGQLAATAVDKFVSEYGRGVERLAERVLQLVTLDESLAQLASA